MELKPFNKLVSGIPAIESRCVKAVMTRLAEHGECQIKMASGDVYSIHLGDLGDFDDNGITFKDASGNVWFLFEEQIESFWTHLGTKE